MARSPLRPLRHLRRYQEIARTFIRHGFGEIVDRLDLLPYLALPRRLLRREPPPHLSLPERVRLALEDLGPTFVKLGQILSTRPDIIPPNFINEFAKLRDTVPPVPWPQIQERIKEELGDSLETLFAEFDPHPIAAASLGQVHTATLPSGEQVVVKVQRPDIEQIIETDLEILFDLARLLQERTPLGKIYDLPAIAEDFGYTLRAELDYRREGRNADRFRRNFAKERYLHIPQIYWEYTTGRVLVMERINGIKIDDVATLETAGYDRHRVALQAARCIVKEVLDDGFFHADPHPGNFIVMPGEVIGAMDFGLVGYLDPRDKAMLLRLYVAGVQMEADKVVALLIKMGVAGRQVDREGLHRDIGRLLRHYQGLPLQEIRADQVFEQVVQIAFRHHLQLPPDLWLLGKTLAMMEGVGLELDPDFDIFVVSEPVVRRLTREMLLPKSWGGPLLKTAVEWAELMATTPESVERLLEQAKEGELQLIFKHTGLDKPLAQLDQIATRLTISILAAALVVALALFIPGLGVFQSGGWGLALAIGAFAAVSFLVLWLLISILRSGKG